MDRTFPSAARWTRRIAGFCAVTAICATCDASSLVGPAGVQDVELSYVGDTVLSSGRSVTPAVGVTVGGEPLAEPRLSFTTSNPDIVSVGPLGELTMGDLGTATITVSLRSSLMPAAAPSISWNMHVVAESLSVSATSLSFVSLGQTMVIAATAFNYQGVELQDPPLRWESTRPDAVAVTQRGIVTAKGAGVADIRAILGPDTAVVSVTVTQLLASYDLSHDDVTFESLGDTLRFTATARDANGSLIELSPATAPVWTSRNASVADVTAGGKVTARQNASTWIVAQRGTVADSVRVNVNQMADTVVISSSTGFGIAAIGDTLALTALGFDRNNNPDLMSQPTWSSLDPGKAQVDPVRGVVTARDTGDVRIVAFVDNAADTVIVSVANPPSSLVLSPPTVFLTSINDTTQLSASTFNARGVPVAAEISWRSTDTTVVRAIASSRIEARGVGTAKIIASTIARIDGTTTVTLADTTTVTVTNDPALVNIPPTDLTLTFVGQGISPEIIIRNARGDALPRTAVTWRSDNTGIASVAADGLVTGVAVGVTTIHATSGSLRDAITVTITNEPATIVLSGQRDTLTAIGQALGYTGEVRNQGGGLLTGYAVNWRSTVPGVATVSSAGLATAAQPGTTMIIGQAGAIADTIVLVVRNPTILWVDNSVAASERFGTLARPFAKIQDAVGAADAGDTVIVRRGFGYAESIALNRRITLTGDSSAFVAGNRNPALLPVIAHDTGSAGISATTTAQLVIRYFSMTHSLDGPAINTAGADVRIEHFHVNASSSAIKLGRGILVRDAPTFAVIADVNIANVRGYGIRLERVVQGQVDRAVVSGVDSIAGMRGAGIDVYRGSTNDIDNAVVRGAQGPGVLLDSTSNASLTASTIDGRSVLVRVRGVSGAITVIERNQFNLNVISSATDTRGSANDGRSGLEIVNSSNVQVRENTFTETGTALMDGIRLITARGGGAFLGVTMFRNRFVGGRYSVRSERSSWTMSESRSDGAVTPVFATDADTIQLVNDTLTNVSGDACVNSTGLVARLEITGSLLTQCGAVGGVGGRAVRMSGSTNTTLSVRSSVLSGPNQTAVHFTGRDLTLRNNVMSGRGTRTVSSFLADGVVDAAATNAATIVENRITDYPAVTGLSLTGGAVVVDSNIVARNGTGLHLLNWASLSIDDNDFSDHEVLGIRNSRSIAATLGATWFGDARGPRRALVPAATGDSTGALVNVGTIRTAPLNPGTPATAIRVVRGSGQTAAKRAILPQAFTVRVMDDQGRPVAGAVVTFTVTDGNGSVSNGTATTDASGLAETTLTLGSQAGSNAVRASIAAPGAPFVTFTATGT